MARPKNGHKISANKSPKNGANLGFEQTLWQAADKLRGNMDASDFWVPKAARWHKLQAATKQPGIGKLLDEVVLALEKDNVSLKGVLPKDYARESLDRTSFFTNESLRG